MRRFSRFSRVSPLELYRESERRAWISAASVLPFFFLLAWAAHLFPVSKPGNAGNKNTDFTAVVEFESCAEEAPPTELRARENTLGLLPRFEEEVRIQLPLAAELDTAPTEVWENDWEIAAELSPEELLDAELPAQLATSAPPRPPARTAPSPARDPAPGELIGASYRATPRPPYPAEMLNRRLEGRVRISIVVDAEGVPQKVEVEHSSGYAAFDRCAREWVLAHWRFHPARRQGVAVASVVHTQVEFVLR